MSGSAAAVLLARRGRQVEVRDRRPGRGRFSGGFQVLENGSSDIDVLDELAALGFDLGEIAVPLREAVLVDPKLGRHTVRSRRPYAYLIRRGAGAGTLDDALALAAHGAGVGVEAGGPDGTWAPDVVATGPRRADGVARELTFTTDHDDLIAVHFDPDLTPTGYAYLFVRDGVGTAGAAQVRALGDLRGNARRAFARLFDLFPMTVEAESERARHMNFGIPGRLEHDGVWYVGEAAGVQEFLFGLGNRLAFRSAGLVAEAVVGDGWDAGAFRRGIVAPMEASVLGRAVFELAGGRTMARLCRWLAAGDFRERLISLQRPTWARRLAARAVMAAWGSRRCCRELPVARWCRREER